MEKYNIKKDKRFEIDVEKTISYIVHILKNPDAALSLVSEVEKAIIQRAKMPKAFKPYLSDKKLKLTVYYIKVQNFYAFYEIDDNKKEMNFIAFIYARMNVSNIIKKLPNHKN